MHRVELHKKALKGLRRIPQARAGQIFKALDELAELPDPSAHRNVISMQGDWEGYSRMRIGSYRAIFKLLTDEEGEDSLIIFVFEVGPRGGVYG